MSDAPIPPPAPEPARNWPGLRPAGWALGLPALALLCTVTVMRSGPAIEREVRRATLEAAARESDSPLARYRARAEIDGRDVAIVSDLGLSDAVRRTLETRIAGARGVRSVRTHVVVAQPMAPFRLTIRKDESGFVLSGGVASPDDREALVERVARLVGADRVEDRLTLATGAPAGFGRMAEYLLGILIGVESGEIQLSDAVFDLHAETRDSQTYRSALAAIRTVPPGFSARDIDLLPPTVPMFSWSAERRPDEIVLGGFVPSEEMRAELARLSSASIPGLPVRDEMETARGIARRVDFLALARTAFASLSEMQTGRVALANRRVSFEGRTVARTEAGAMAQRIRTALPSGVEIGPVDIAVVPASPFLFSARRTGGQVILAGYVPADAERKVAAGLMNSRFPGERLVDRLVLADGAPPGFADAVRVAVETLAELAEGEASIRDRDLRIAGRVLYGQLAARLRRTLPKAVPANWTASIALEPPPPEQAIDSILCGDLLADTARRLPIRFAAGQSAAPSGPPIDSAAAIVRRCGSVDIRVVHHLAAGDNPEAARPLAEARATAVATAIGARGVTARLSGEGVVVPKSADGAPAGPTDRTDFVVLQP